MQHGWLPRRRLSSLTLLAGLALTLAAAQLSPLAVTLESYLVTEVRQADGTLEEAFLPAETAEPGQVLEYRLSVHNESGDTLNAGTVAVTGPVPAGAMYVADSATTAQARLEFSLDGGATYAEIPVVSVTDAYGNASEASAPPESFTSLRWTVLEPLAPGEILTFIYRVAVR